MTKKKIKVLVALSGGVDSSVAAAFLVKQGYDVTGMFAVNYDDKSTGISCWQGDYQDALRVAAKLGIPLLRWDFQKEYKKDVLNYMFKEYEAGRTPNPDVLCNKFVKFGAWLVKARALGFDYLATGHYARLGREIPNSKFQIPNKSKYPISNIQLLQSKDADKDQTYFLHQLSQEQLRYVMFPIGDYTKPEVRKLAKKFALPTADKEESMGICFVGEVPMKEFLQTRIKSKPGNITLSSTVRRLAEEVVASATGGEGDGIVVGKHDGLAFYTLGQRIGIKYPISNIQYPINSQSSISKPFFVVGKDLKNNILIVGHEDDPQLYKKEIIIEKPHFIAPAKIKFPLRAKVRFHHRASLRPARITAGPGDSLTITLAEAERAPAPGQFAVFYRKGECLGGGVIQ